MEEGKDIFSDSVQEVSSFRDPSGFLFWDDGVLYRKINPSCDQDYKYLMDSGLYDCLMQKGYLIPHKEAEYQTIKPALIPFISYPYEWCFGQLKDATLLTLEIQKTALQYGMTLKDASAYNVQFDKGKPIFIDTLSFEEYKEGEPWIAYRQFCEHFLCPLVLASYRDMRLIQLLKSNIDGIPLDLTSQLLPIRTYFNFGIVSHIHVHAKTQRQYANKPIKPRKLSKTYLLNFIENLRTTVEHLEWKQRGFTWADYQADLQKQAVVSQWLDKIQPKTLLDLGANTGVFSHLAARKGIEVISVDNDPACVEENYKAKDSSVLPLVVDLTNPPPSIGWECKERASFWNRAKVDCCLMLALIHHLAISNNIPFQKIADLLSRVCDTLIIEFVPKTDSKVQLLLRTRRDIYGDYTQEHFETEFGKHFSIKEQMGIDARTMYLMVKR